MTGPKLFLSLNPIDVTELPEKVSLVQSELGVTELLSLCAAAEYRILWRGLPSHPNWHPREGRFDRASAVEIDRLERQLTLLQKAGITATYDYLALPAVTQEEMPAHWVAGGAHPINVGSVKSARRFEPGDTIVLCQFKVTARKNLPLSAPAFHGNPGVEQMLETDLQLSDLVPIEISFRSVKLNV